MNNDQIVASVSYGVAKAIAGIRFRMEGMPRTTLDPGALEAFIAQTMGQASPNDIAERRELITAMDRQNELLRRQNELLQEIADKESTVEVTTNSFARAANRKNRRDGRTTIPVGT